MCRYMHTAWIHDYTMLDLYHIEERSVSMHSAQPTAELHSSLPAYTRQDVHC